MTRYCGVCKQTRELNFFRILDKDTDERDTTCNYCIPKICSKCPIDPKTMRDTVNCLQDFQTKGFDKNTRAQLFDSMCITCFKFRDDQRKKGVELSRTSFKMYNGIAMRICKGEKCNGKYIPLNNFNIMTNKADTLRKCSNFQHRCIECSALHKATTQQSDIKRSTDIENKHHSAKKRELKVQKIFEQNKERKPNDSTKKRYCECGINRSQCKKCGGAVFCEHGKQRNRCKECGGASICEHLIRRSDCKICHGGSICEHNQIRSKCIDCNSLEKLQNSKTFCSICGVTRLSKLRKVSQICASCNDNSIDRTEVEIRKKLLSMVPPPSAQDNILFGQTCDVVKKRRPDLMWVDQDRVVIGEIDENGGHGNTNYTPECDFGWVMDMTSALIKLFQVNDWNDGNIPHIFVIRMNPDECDANPKPLDDRIQLFAERINHYCTCALDEYEARVPNIEYHFYHSKCSKHIEYAKKHSSAANVLQ